MGRKKARSMTGGELRRIRVEMRYDRAGMAAILGWKYRTYQDREDDKRGIAPREAEQVRAAQVRDREVMAELMAKLSDRINHEFPNGIPSD